MSGWVRCPQRCCLCSNWLLCLSLRDCIAKALYYLLFEWLLLRINEWLAPWESDCAVGIVDIHGFEVIFNVFLLTKALEYFTSGSC